MARVTSKYNLAIINPRLAKEWHWEKNGDLRPLDVTPKSEKKVWWRCKKGHVWKTRVENRHVRGRGCVYCCNQRANIENCLATNNPETARLWNKEKNGRLTPYKLTPGSKRRVWWKCRKKHEWQAEVYSVAGGSRCPYCSGKRASGTYNLAVLDPKLASEWHHRKNAPLTPFEVTPMSSNKVWWQCGKGHEWKATVAHRSQGRGCPRCWLIRIGASKKAGIKP